MVYLKTSSYEVLVTEFIFSPWVADWGCFWILTSMLHDVYSTQLSDGHNIVLWLIAKADNVLYSLPKPLIFIR